MHTVMYSTTLPCPCSPVDLASTVTGTGAACGRPGIARSPQSWQPTQPTPRCQARCTDVKIQQRTLCNCRVLFAPQTHKLSAPPPRLLCHPHLQSSAAHEGSLLLVRSLISIPVLCPVAHALAPQNDLVLWATCGINARRAKATTASTEYSGGCFFGSRPRPTWCLVRSR